MESAVRRLLDRLGLAQHAAAFEANAIDAETLPDLTDADLRELGLHKLGERRRLLRAIADAPPQPQEPASASGMAEPAPVQETPASSRRHVTVLFCDLVGSSRLAASLDPEDMSDLLNRYHATCAERIGRLGGHVAQYLGDGMLAYFGYPAADEDAAAQAVRAGLALGRDVAGIVGPAGKPLAARIGIASGIVIAPEHALAEGQGGRAVVGDTPNVAALLQTIAPVGSVVVAGSTRQLLGEQFELVDLGPQPLKGIDPPPHAFRVVGERALASRFEARRGVSGPLIGRELEMAVLARCWRQAAAGSGQGVLMTGEAGIGKSRLARELIDVAAAEQADVLVFQCSPHHRDSALWPVAHHLGQAAGILPEDGPDVCRAKLADMSARWPEAPADLADLLASLLGMPPAAASHEPSRAPQSPSTRRARTLDALVAWLRALAADRPTLVLIEDMHWADPTTTELVERALAGLADVPAMLLLTGRISDGMPTGDRPHVMRLGLSRLARPGAEAMVHRCGGGGLAADVVAQILGETDGNPLFIEEMTKTVLLLGEARVPQSLQDSLLARLDRIEDVKKIAQVAACLGREFDPAVLARAMSLADTVLDQALGRLRHAEILLEDEYAETGRSIFKHALVRDAAYESLLRAERRHWHGRIAEVLEQDYGETARPDSLAYHHELAGNAAAALEYWYVAGNRERDRSAHREAAAHYARAIRLAEAAPELAADRLRLIDLHTELGAQYIAVKGNGAEEVVETFRKVYALCESMPGSAATVRALHSMRTHYLVRGPIERAYELGERILDITERVNDAGLRLQAYRPHGLCLFAMGRFRDGLQLLARSAELYDQAQHSPAHFHYPSDPLVLAKCNMGWCHVFLGDDEAARAEADDAVALARRLRHAHSEAFAASLQASVYAALGDGHRVAELSRALVALADANGFPYWRAWGLALGGWAAALVRDDRGGLAQLQQAIADYGETGATMMIGYFEALRAEASLHLHDIAQAEAAAAAAAAQPDANGVRFYEAEIRRLSALAGMASGRLDKAAGRDLLNTAAILAKRQGNRWAAARIAAV